MLLHTSETPCDASGNGTRGVILKRPICYAPQIMQIVNAVAEKMRASTKRIRGESIAMTDEEIIRACAEKVMEWVQVHDPKELTEGTFGINSFGHILRPHRSEEWQRWNPLTSDADAFMVMDKARLGVMPWTNGRWIAFRPDLDGAWLGLSDAPGDRMYDGALRCGAVDADRRRAIVLAALKTVGIECPDPSA